MSHALKSRKRLIATIGELEHEMELLEKKNKHLVKIQEDHQEEIRVLVKKHNEAIEDLDRKHEQERLAIMNENQITIQSKQTEFEDKIAEVKRDQLKAVAEAERRLNSELDAERKELYKSILASDSDVREQLGNMPAKIMESVGTLIKGASNAIAASNKTGPEAPALEHKTETGGEPVTAAEVSSQD